MIGKAAELAEKHGWFMTRQFENEANPDYHSATTAREILRDFEGEALDYWVTGYGTGGTLKGVARVLAAERPGTRIVVCEAADAPVLSSGLPQDKDAAGNPVGTHPAYSPHPMQGWGPNFMSRLTGDTVDMDIIDRVITVTGEAAMACSRDLARREGIFTGITSGATFAGALKLCAGAAEGATILCMLPDTGERYLSTPLFDGVDAEMDADELAIALSTPGHRIAAG
jgi:cysteine synthase A